MTYVLVLFSRISLRSVDHTIKAQERTFTKHFKVVSFLTLCVSYCFYGEVYDKWSRKCFLIAVFLSVRITLTSIGMNFAWLIRCHWLLAWLCIRGIRTTKQQIRWGFVSSQREYSKRHENGESTNQAKLTDPNQHPYFRLCPLTFACQPEMATVL